MLNQPTSVVYTAYMKLNMLSSIFLQRAIVQKIMYCMISEVCMHVCVCVLCICTVCVLVVVIMCCTTTNNFECVIATSFIIYHTVQYIMYRAAWGSHSGCLGHGLNNIWTPR